MIASTLSVFPVAAEENERYYHPLYSIYISSDDFNSHEVDQKFLRSTQLDTLVREMIKEGSMEREGINTLVEICTLANTLTAICTVTANIPSLQAKFMKY